MPDIRAGDLTSATLSTTLLVLTEPPPRPRALDGLEQFLEEHADELWERFPWPGVRAFGVRNWVTEDGKRDYTLGVIAAYVETAAQVPAGSHSIAGVPIEFVVVGPWDQPESLDRQ